MKSSILSIRGTMFQFLEREVSTYIKQVCLFFTHLFTHLYQYGPVYIYIWIIFRIPLFILLVKLFQFAIGNCFTLSPVFL